LRWNSEGKGSLAEQPRRPGERFFEKGEGEHEQKKRNVILKEVSVIVKGQKLFLPTFVEGESAVSSTHERIGDA